MVTRVSLRLDTLVLVKHFGIPFLFALENANGSCADANAWLFDAIGVFPRRHHEMTPHIWRMFLSPGVVFSFQRSGGRVASRATRFASIHGEHYALRRGIGTLLDDSNYLNYATETMPLSQQLSGLLEKSTGVKASRKRTALDITTNRFFFRFPFVFPVPSIFTWIRNIENIGCRMEPRTFRLGCLRSY